VPPSPACAKASVAGGWAAFGSVGGFVPSGDTGGQTGWQFGGQFRRPQFTWLMSWAQTVEPTIVSIIALVQQIARMDLLPARHPGTIRFFDMIGLSTTTGPAIEGICEW